MIKKLKEIPRFYIDIAFLFIAEVLWALGSNMYKDLLPVHMKSIVQNPQLVSLILSIGTFTGVLALCSGWLSKRYNLKWLLVMCWAVTVPAPLLFALAKSSFLFILGQIIYSLTTMFAPAVVLYIFDYDYPGDKLPVYLLYCLVSQIASVAGPAIGGLIAAALDMRQMLLVSFALYTLSTISTLFMSRAKDRKPEEISENTVKEPFHLKKHLVEYGRIYIWMFFLMSISAIQCICDPLISVYLTDLKGFTTEQLGFGFTMACLGGVFFTYVIRKKGKSWRMISVTIGLTLIYAASMFGLFAQGVVLLITMLFLRGSAKSMTFYQQGTFTEIAKGPKKEMFVSAFFAIRSVMITIANNIGGAIYKQKPESMLLVELLCIAVWLVGFVLFTQKDQKTHPVA